MKVLLLIIFTYFYMFGSYIKDDELKIYSFDYFVGGMYSFNYLNSSDSIDRYDYSYGGYIGIRNKKDYEFILKKDKLDANDYSIDFNSFRINIPLVSLFSRRVYLGISYGNDDFKFKQKNIDSVVVTNKKDKSSFYSIAFGKRYKFARFFYVRTEIEYIKFNNQIKLSGNKDFSLNNSLNFNYFVEYSF